MGSKDRASLNYMLHSVVYDTAFSPCGKYLAAGNKFGDVALFSLQAALSPDTRPETKFPVFTFSVFSSGSIYCMKSKDSLLICAGEGSIQAFKWADILAKNPKVIWSLSVPKKGMFSNPEVNCCIITDQNEGSSLFAGVGDGDLHQWDLEAGAYKGSLNGHSDLVQDIVSRDNGQGLVSVSEDGTARIWDLRAKEAVNIIKPYEEESVARPEMGRWLQCLALNQDDYWLLLGGGPTLAAWHLKTLTPAATFPTPAAAQTTAFFHEDKILSGGSGGCFHHWAVTGEQLMAVPTAAPAVYSLRLNTASPSHRVLVASGSSAQIDVCTNLGYTAFQLTFLPPA